MCLFNGCPFHLPSVGRSHAGSHNQSEKAVQCMMCLLEADVWRRDNDGRPSGMYVKHKDILLHTISLPKQAKGGSLDPKSCAASCYYNVLGEMAKSRGQPCMTHMRGESAFSECG